MTIDDLIGGCKLIHLDASDSGTLFTDVAGTTGATDGDVVKNWGQQSGVILSGAFSGTNGYTYRSNYLSSGYSALEGNGSNSVLSKETAGIVPFTKLYFVLALSRPVSPTTQQTFLSIGNDALHYIRMANVNATSLRIQAAGTDGGATALLQPATISASSLRMVITGSIGLNHNFIATLDGSGASASGPHISSSIVDDIHLGGRYAADSQIFSGGLHEIILGDGNCERGQIERAAKILRDKWGVSDPSPLPSAAVASGNVRLIDGGLIR